MQKQESLQQKQKFLRSEIIEKQIDAECFMQFMGKIKSQGQNIDLENWSLKELKEVVIRYRQEINKNKQEMMSSRLSKDVRKTKIFQSAKKQKCKYQGTNLWDFQQNYQVECAKSELAFQFPQGVPPKIQIEAFQLKNVGGFLFGIGSRNQLQLTISSNFTANKIIRKVEDCDWLKSILSLKHLGCYVPPLQQSREFASDDKKGINARVLQITQFLNSLLDYQVFRYSSYFKEFLTQQNLKKFHDYKARQFQFARQKDIFEIESISGSFNVNISDSLNQALKKSSLLTNDLSGLYGQLGSCMNKLINDLDTVLRTSRHLNEITNKIGQKVNQINSYFNYNEIKLPSILQNINNSLTIMNKNLKLQVKNLYQFNQNFIKTSVKDWNQLLAYDRRRQNQVKIYVNSKESLLRKKQKWMNDPTKWELPQVQLQKILKQGIGKLNKQQIFDKMFPSENQKESHTRIWLSFVNQNHLTSFKQFLSCHSKSLLINYSTYSSKFIAYSQEVSQSYKNFFEARQQFYQEMNALPQILRQSNASTVYRRQGPFYNLKLNATYGKTQNNTERYSSQRKSRLMVNRYSIGRGELESRRANYSTISYDFRSDPQFYGTKGKKDQIESYQILMAQRQKEVNIVQGKVRAFEGTRQYFEQEYRNIKIQFEKDLSSFQNDFSEKITNLRLLLSNLRKQTQLQIKSFKKDIKIENEQLIVYCQQMKMIDKHYKKVKMSLEQQN